MQSSHPDFVAPDEAVERRVNSLLVQLTLSEKIQLLGGQPKRGATFPINRLGIPEFKMSDGPMGVHWWCSHATAYPALFLAAASFDRSLWQGLGVALGRDCRARGVHMLLAPGVNLYRSPLCGRNFEYAGEDPYLSAQVAVGFIQGVQSQGVTATVKHFACNFQEYGRHNISSDLDERTLCEMYLPAFESAVKEAGVGAVMTAYNLINGVHCSEDPWLLNDVLKSRWGFQGIVMSDWVSVYSDKAAANAGLDLEMPTAQWLNEEHLLPLIAQGAVLEPTIDDKVRRLLRLATCFGWFDRDQLDPSILHDDPESKEAALDIARGGIVLLKNERELLPLSASKLGRVAVLGPYAHPALFSGGGSAYTTPHSSVSVLAGLRTLLGDRVEVLHSSGPEPNPQRLVFGNSDFQSSLGKGLVGEYFNNPEISGTPVITRLDEYLNFTWGPSVPVPEITVENFSARWHGTLTATTDGLHLFYSRSHDSVYRVLLDGKAIIDTFAGERNGLHTSEVRLVKGQTYTIEVIWRKTRYWGGMQLGYECIENRGKEIAECVAVAKSVDVAVLCVGFDNVSEGEGFDRPFAMNPQLEELVLRVSEVQPNTIIVLTAGGNVDMRRWLSCVPALLFVGYPGQEGGVAIAEVLFGKICPSGKLPATFEKRLEDRSSYESYHDDDHDQRVALSDGIFTGYRHADTYAIEPQFYFGFGLSYTEFSYENLELDRSQINVGDSITVRFDIVNRGQFTGSEVAQVYVRDNESSVPRPVQELKGFTKVRLLPGERQQIEIALGPRAFAFYDPTEHGFRVEPGAFELLIGASSRDIRLRSSIEIL